MMTLSAVFFLLLTNISSALSLVKEVLHVA